jgi:hypothetical protein
MVKRIGEDPAVKEKKVKKEVGWHITCGIVVAVAVMV